MSSEFHQFYGFKELDEQILNEEFGFKRFEAIKLMKFARHGHLPKPSE
jgi:hypothetical protein